MASNDALRATPAEIKKRTISDLLREREGYEQRLNGAEEGTDLAAMLERRVDEVNAQLRHHGVDAAPAARRSEKRPVVSARAETR